MVCWPQAPLDRWSLTQLRNGFNGNAAAIAVSTSDTVRSYRHQLTFLATGMGSGTHALVPAVFAVFVACMCEELLPIRVLKPKKISLQHRRRSRHRTSTTLPRCPLGNCLHNDARQASRCTPCFWSRQVGPKCWRRSETFSLSN